jgi:hypothetical protein
VDESAHQLVRQQEIVIDVLRQRVFELEVELINARCATQFNSHSHAQEPGQGNGAEPAESPPEASESPVAAGAVSSVP